MGTSIRALLLSQMDSFTPSEQKVAQALLDRYPSLPGRLRALPNRRK